MTFREEDHPRDENGRFTDGKTERSADCLKRVWEKHFPHLTEGKKMFKISLQFFADKESGIQKQESNSIRRSMRKLRRRILEHEDKISNPERYSEDWNTISDERKKKRLEYWRTEIEEFKKSIQRRIDELKKEENMTMSKENLDSERVKHIVFRVLQNANKVLDMRSKKNASEYVNGLSDAYYEVLSTIQSELIIADQDLSEFGLDIDLEKTFL